MYRSKNTALPAESEWVSRPMCGRRAFVVDLAIISMVLTVATVVILRLWEADLRVPFGYGGDGLIYSRDAKTIVETGWIQTTSRLGAPFGQEMYDFTISGDNGNYLLMKLMAIVTDDWGLILNAFFLGSFYTASWSAYFCMRWLGCGRTSSVVCAVLFGLAPYHFGRGAGHLMLSSYFVVPISVLLVVRAASGRPLAGRPLVDRDRRMTLRSLVLFLRSAAPWLILCLVCGSFGSYYFFFTLISMLLASLVVAGSRRSLRPMMCALSYGATVAAAFLFNILPNLLYRREHGVNPYVAQREASEIDIYGLRLIQMITPVPGHWIGALRSVSRDLTRGFQSEPSQFLGLVATAAILLMFGWLGVAIVRGPDRAGVTSTDAKGADVRLLLGFLTLAWILIASTGGLEWVVTIVGFTQLRAWNRVSILLMFVCLTWLALTVGPRLASWSRHSASRRRTTLGLASLVLVFGVADQGSASFVTETDVYAPTFASDKAFFASVEAALPSGSMVYQLPYRRFPEEVATVASADYDLLRPYLQTDTIRWSYGGMKGREADWQRRLEGTSVTDFVRNIRSVGFVGVLVDRAGYSDYGIQLEQEINAVTGVGGSQSSDGRWVFFDLSRLADPSESAEVRSRLADELLYSPRIDVEDCADAEGAGVGEFNWCGTRGSIRVTDPAPDGRPNVLTAEIEAPGGEGTLYVDVDGLTTEFTIGPSLTTVSFAVPSAEVVTIQLSTDVPRFAAAGDARDLRFRLIFPQVTAQAD